MNAIYAHKQFGQAAVLIIVLPVFGFLAVAAWLNQPLIWFIVAFVTIFMLISLAMLSSMTVHVDNEKVHVFYGPGFPSFSFPLGEIRAVQVVRNTPMMGIGIHFIRRGMIYNISGLDGVELAFVSGRRAIIGTDEPEALVQAIKARMMTDWQTMDVK
jgi:hypothetical protein